MEKTPSPTGDAIKRKLSLSDVADALGISRPTLYRYIEEYDRGDYSHISGDAFRLFDLVSREEVGPEDAQILLIDIRSNVKRASEEGTSMSSLERSKEKVMGSVQRIDVRRQPDTGLRWIPGKVKVTSVGQGGKSMVIFDGPEGRYRLRLWMDIDGKPYRIAEYENDDGRRFFLVDDVLPRPGYRYDVVCETKDGEVCSDLQELRFR